MQYAGFSEDAAESVQHIQFEGYDTDPDGGNGCYGASVPADKAADPRREVVLAYLMNGECVLSVWPSPASQCALRLSP